MLSEAGPGLEAGQLNFTMFLTLFGVKMTGTDSEEVIKNAFSIFDENGNGFICEDKFRDVITTIGDRYSVDEVSFFLFIFRMFFSMFLDLRLMSY
jgi:Ca2+-binding EF-hand superfamily protein